MRHHRHNSIVNIHYTVLLALRCSDVGITSCLDYFRKKLKFQTFWPRSVTFLQFYVLFSEIFTLHLSEIDYVRKQQNFNIDYCTFQSNKSKFGQILWKNWFVKQEVTNLSKKHRWTTSFNIPYHFLEFLNLSSVKWLPFSTNFCFENMIF